MSSSSAGRATLNLVIADIDEIVRVAVAAALPSAVAGEVELAVRGEAGGTILADAQRVAEVIENLLSNAVKFTPQHGRVDVEVSGDADAVSVCVLDTGQGIAEDDASRLFDRFFRVSDAEGLPGRASASRSRRRSSTPTADRSASRAVRADGTNSTFGCLAPAPPRVQRRDLAGSPIG